MNRREFSGLVTASAAGSLLAAPALATTKALDDNQNFFLDSQRVVFRLGTQTLLIAFILLITTRGVLAIDTRQPQPVVNERRASAGNVPLLGGLFKKPLSAKTVSALPRTGDIYISGGNLVANWTSSQAVPSKAQAAIPVPYPEVRTSFRPTARFAPVRMKNPPTAAALSRQKAFGSLHFDAKSGTMIFALPGIRQA